MCLSVAPFILGQRHKGCYLALDFREKSAYFTNTDKVHLVFLLPSVNVPREHSEKSVNKDEKLNNRQHPFLGKEVDEGEDYNNPEKEVIELIDAVSAGHEARKSLAPAWLSAAVIVVHGRRPPSLWMEINPREYTESLL